MPTALNPIDFTEQVVRDFLRYQATTFRFADGRLRARLRELLSMEQTRSTPLLKGPYVSLSKSFQVGASIASLVDEGLLHPHMANLAEYPNLYRHQELALRSIVDERPTLVSTGTGSGKTECFLYPVIDRCLRLRDENAPPGIRAILVYPMNALAEDQLLRLRGMLCGRGIPFGMYVGKTPDHSGGVTGEVLPPGSTSAEYEHALARSREQRLGTSVHPPEERVHRESMRTAGGQPRILLTNVKMLELLLTRGDDAELFDGAELEYLVFDEAHTFSGANGAESAALVRRLVELIGSRERGVTYVGTSATLTDPASSDAPARRFASRFFGAREEDVAVITEEYEQEGWSEGRSLPVTPPREPSEHLREVLEALARNDEEAEGEAIARAWSEFQPQQPALDPQRWSEHLFELLSGNEACFRLFRHLGNPVHLDELARTMSEATERNYSEEELLAWLALGAAAQKEGRPLLRPKVHVFLRGLDGGVVDFSADDDEPEPRLWLSAQDQFATFGEEDAPFRLPVTVCTTCGQHYFVHHAEDLEVTAAGLGGGAASERGGRVWESLTEEEGGARVVLLDRLVGDEDDDDEDSTTSTSDAAAPRRCHRVFFCRRCGALHDEPGSRCAACGQSARLVRLWSVEFDKNDKAQSFGGVLTSCLACRAPGSPRGTRYREPARAVRATAVADVHVLAQNMLQRSSRERLLVFTDNRQEAAFQAGWMRDHARHFRLRALLAEALGAGNRSLGDIVSYLESVFDADIELSRALLPEVWQVARSERVGRRHLEKRKEFLRLQVLLEITQAKKQTRGLEPWGRLRVDYHGLESSLPIVRSWAARLGVEAERMADGFAALLDLYRRDRMVFDPETRIFSKTLGPWDQVVMDGFVPELKGIPKALKFARGASDRDSWIMQLWSQRGQSRLRKAAAKFGVPSDEAKGFVEDFWKLFAEELKVLKPVGLTGSKGKNLPGTSGGHQIDADALVIEPHKGRWRCGSCQRTQVRPTPLDRCLQHNCTGTLAFEEEDPEDYDLNLLDEGVVLVRPHEHSAQVPVDERERIETLFKGDGDAVNTLVCTPTLEMGVDIGGLDTVLLRNVPPQPSNYWQRVGRAGRRHRLAVAATYARPASHDRAYFADPPKMLEGRVEPPRFNLANQELVAKHARATVLTGLRQLSRDPERSETDRQRVTEVLARCFPNQIKSFFFDEEEKLRIRPRDVSELGRLIEQERETLLDLVCRTFADRWPEDDRDQVTPERLADVVDGVADVLAGVLTRIGARLRWHLEQIERINQQSQQFGTPSDEEIAHRRRCESYVKRIKGKAKRHRSDAEGHDETYTWSVLAAEGFLPGYGLESGSIRASAELVVAGGKERDLVLGRAPAVALREYVPGNMIYANGQRFAARRYQLKPVDPIRVAVDPESESVRDPAASDGIGSMAAIALPAVPICDVELVHRSRISDDEEHRFQLPVATYAMELGRHKGGHAYRWGEQDLQLRRGLQLRLVNVGTARAVEAMATGGGEIGYPMCRADGDTRSPFASPHELQKFEEHKAERGFKVERVGFYADVVVDALTFLDIEDRETAWSLIEALRMAMAEVLEMEREDLQGQVIGEPGTERVSAMLYDPMPGGSGLLDQALAEWKRVVGEAKRICTSCPAVCERSCIDCLQHFRNAFRHGQLNRHRVIEVTVELGSDLAATHAIPPQEPRTKHGGYDQGEPTNDAERRLKDMLERAGLGHGEYQRQLALVGCDVPTTTPDVFFELDDPYEQGICVYLDGLSVGIHGNQAVHDRDSIIRASLASSDYTVIEIPASHLESKDEMCRHFYRIARALLPREDAIELRERPDWYE